MSSKSVWSDVYELIDNAKVNCSEIQDLAAALVDHEPLNAIDLDEVESHLKTCSSCQYEYEMDLMTSHIVRARIPLVNAPREAYRSILDAMEAY